MPELLSHTPDQKENEYKEFQHLREKMHDIIKTKTKERIRKNPKPRKIEKYIGAFEEMIEPQVKDALFEFYRKGYITESSGFGGENGEIQSLDGYFEIDEKSKERIEKLGAKVLKGKDLDMPGQSEHYTYIQFYPEKPDINDIKKKWDAIAAILPDRKKEIEPSISGGSEQFREKYSPDDNIERMMLKRRLVLDEFSPEREKEMKERLKELSQS